MSRSNFKQFTIGCVTPNCGNITSKAYARTHNGKCKSCFTGVPQEKAEPRRRTLKPGQYFEDDGGEYRFSAEYRHEVMGGNEPSDY